MDTYEIKGNDDSDKESSYSSQSALKRIKKGKKDQL